MSPLGVLLLGFVLGVRHATDADHVVAVSTIVSRRGEMRAAGLVGAAWGAGHTLTIVVVGGAIVLFSLAVPPRLGLAMEFAVAVMLVVLGVANLAGRERAHAHADRGQDDDHRLVAQLARPLGVGVVHGLAGSAAIALLVVTTIRSPGVALLYLLLFGWGTIVGMAMLTSVIALPFAMTANRFARFHRTIVQASSLASIGLGVFLAYKIGIADGLFTGAARWTPE